MKKLFGQRRAEERHGHRRRAEDRTSGRRHNSGKLRHVVQVSAISADLAYNLNLYVHCRRVPCGVIQHSRLLCSRVRRQTTQCVAVRDRCVWTQVSRPQRVPAGACVSLYCPQGLSPSVSTTPTNAYSKLMGSVQELLGATTGLCVQPWTMDSHRCQLIHTSRRLNTPL